MSYLDFRRKMKIKDKEGILFSGNRGDWALPLTWAIWAAVVPLVPKYTMAKQVEMPQGEKKIFLPSADSASFLLNSRANWLIDFVRESIGKIWAPTKGGQSRLEKLEESLELAAVGRQLKGQLPGSLCRDLPHTIEAIFIGQRIHLWFFKEQQYK